ncbi:MAG: cupin domain-containing protein [Alphaproteobacteria bacterium]|nr:cupin domain-containing protein [Alphaproteobacteria bacterium]
MTSLTAAQIIDTLAMQPHPEGGHFVETFRDTNQSDGNDRSPCTAIYYLLQAGEVSAWHRVTDASEIWHWYAGAPLALRTSPDGEQAGEVRLGPDLPAGERPQAVVEAGHWQSAEPLGAWTLVGCTVAPGFEFASFEIAPADWQPGK